MLDTIMVTMVFIVLIGVVLLLIRLSILFLRQQISITRLFIGAYYCFGFVILWECYRILYFVFTKSVDVPFDRFAFALNFFLIIFAVSLISQATMIGSKQSGHRISHDTFIKNIYFVAAIIFAILNGYTYYQSELNAFGFYTYQVNTTLTIIIIIVYTPLLIFMIIKNIITLKEIRNKILLIQISILSSLFVIMIVERFLILTLYNFLLSPLAILIDLFIILCIALSSLILSIKNIKIFEEISTYFNVKSVYLLWKKDGQMIYGYDFQKEGDPDPFAPDRLLLGGFIYAISHGLEASLKTEGQLESIQIGDITLLFKHGKYVIGILFITEETPMVHLKLLLLMQRFERRYKTELEHRTGDLSKLSLPTLQDWIDEMFR